jgi:ABC-2 type transport system ATP-binding protein
VGIVEKPRKRRREDYQAMTYSAPTIEAIRLTKKYGNFTALDNLNLKIEGAKCVGFLGPNGAGKTTTLKIFTDLIHSSSGQALINGADVHTEKKKALAAVATVVETPEIYPALTPKEALMMIAEQRGVPADMKRRKIDDALQEVRMEEWGDKRVGKFSKGMKQRIIIASALLNDPEIILLDEPTGGLDPRGMSEVRDIVKRLKKQKRLIFMSSHLLSEVTDICDEVAMIDHGKLVAYDKIQSLTERFSGMGDVVEIGFVRRVNEDIFKIVQGILGITSVEKIDDRNIRAKFTGGPEAQERILFDLVSLKLGVNSLRPSTSALEDVYLKLITETV